MKRLLTTFFALGIACGAMALNKPQLDARAEKLFAKFDALQAKPDLRVPPDVLARARGIILLDRTKAGFIFAYQGGSGVAMVKDKKGQWSPLGWLKADEASLGFQIGGQQTFFVILLMTEESAKTLIADAAFEFGGEARGTGGNRSAGVEGKVESLERPVLIYDDRHGLFGGVSVKGGALSADYDANAAYYGARLDLQEILFDKKAKPTPAAATLATKLDRFAKAAR